jgi:DNA-entry nuclease
MNKNNKQMKLYRKTKNIILLVTIIICMILAIFNNSADNETYNNTNIYNITNTNTIDRNVINNNDKGLITLNNIPPYNGNAYIELNNNMPEFEEKDFTTVPFEDYSDLDKYKRCGVAFANVCKEIMPKEGEKRKSISHIKNLSGWVQKEYPNIIGTKNLYNRCHLIGWQLSNENANIRNLMTGTAYLNQAMIKWENDIATYIKDNERENKKYYHVLYRVTPIFEGENKLASGVHMEAMSVEEREKGIYFNIYIYNVQPNIEIDYSTGESYEKLLLNE